MTTGDNASELPRLFTACNERQAVDPFFYCCRQAQACKTACNKKSPVSMKRYVFHLYDRKADRWDIIGFARTKFLANIVSTILYYRNRLYFIDCVDV